MYKIEKCDESTGCCEDGFSCLNSASFEEEIRNEINAKRVVILLAQDQGGKGGHYMVIDSFDNEGRFHINFGWGGNCNNYYYLSDINTFEICGGIDYKFNTNQKAIINIQQRIKIGKLIDVGFRGIMNQLHSTQTTLYPLKEALIVLNC
ncbi:MAG: C10 family peptidase [Saprospiraceae bacterium]|nr:C10 family peptidase [Candidatus Opimibacter skivensis]